MKQVAYHCWLQKIDGYRKLTAASNDSCVNAVKWHEHAPGYCDTNHFLPPDGIAMQMLVRHAMKLCLCSNERQMRCLDQPQN
jgi:hypothetical protein